MLIEDKFYQKICLELNENIIEISKSKRKIINQAVEDLINGGGKKLRPFLMFLAASFGDYDKQKLLELGSGIEILHMASLLHDDIIDNADLRRGRETAQKKFGKKEAVFIGDFLLSRTFDVFFEHLDKDVLKKMNKNIRLLCEGEIEQSEKRFDLQVGIKDYYRRIRHKTALLFALSSYLGAYVSGIRGRKLNILYKLGLEIGMAFQIQDDLLDFEGDEKNTGKILAQDLKEGIITLPVILLLNKSKYKNKYAAYNKESLDDEVINDIIADIKSSGVLEESREILLIFIKRVKKYMSQLPDNKAKKKLKKLIKVQVERKF
ncbi:MAG: polyprenyl synthetase family protein [Halanaerobium sp.]